jgi:anthranilate synthase/aminodeoxychorismate synthase-like glutamine amidotransferase
MKTLLIDHDDSFTYNLQHWLQPICSEVTVVNHRDLPTSVNADLVVLSPGPKSPQHYPQVINFINNLPLNTAVYGVCLGLQLLVHSSGGLVKPYAIPLHGKKSKLNILNSKYLELQNLEVARYHSLYCAELSTVNFNMLAETSDDTKIPMWLMHNEKKWMGVQFHPESFLTEKPELHLKILNDWLKNG